MKIQDLIAGKNEQDSVVIDGTSIPVKVLKDLTDEGYVHVRPYKENRTFSFWGKSCTACFTEDQLLERA
ncbi:MAG TPA: hypothetical protein ENH70_02965 [Desulfobacteraceae bacterium]|nr:hypothetical protein [Desulfobacteraceae bacterium]